jgi:hypothetical protein
MDGAAELRDRAKAKTFDPGKMKHRIQGVKEKAMEDIPGIET